MPEPGQALAVAATPRQQGFGWTSSAATGAIACNLDYDLSGWSLIYKQTSGKGTVRCSNGQRMAVKINAKAPGLTVGKRRINLGVDIGCFIIKRR